MVDTTQQIFMVTCRAWDSVYHHTVYLGTYTTDSVEEAFNAQEELEDAFPSGRTTREAVWIQ